MGRLSYLALPKLYTTTLPCIYKMYFNDYYIIVKSKDAIKSIEAIQKALNQFMRGSEFQNKKDNLYYHFFSKINENKEAGKFRVELVYESENLYELLKSEQLELNKSKRDTKCLNNNSEAYIPLYNEEKESYGWLPKFAVMNFKKWLKTNNKQLQ